MTRGWCPSVHRPMELPDGWLVRLKPRLGGLSAAQVAWLSTLPEPIRLTSRANLQIRGLSAARARVLAGQAVEIGAAWPDPALEGRRNLLVSPLAGLDPACDPDTLSIAAEIEAGLGRLPHLSDKFGFAVDGMEDGLRADVTLRAREGVWRLIAGGILREVPTAHAAAAALDAARETGPRPPLGPARTLIGPLSCGAFGLGAPHGLAGAFSALGALRVTPWRGVVAARGPAPGWIARPDDPRLRVSGCDGCAPDTLLSTLADTLSPEERLHVVGCPKACGTPGDAIAISVADARARCLRRAVVSH